MSKASTLIPENVKIGFSPPRQINTLGAIVVFTQVCVTSPVVLTGQMPCQKSCNPADVSCFFIALGLLLRDHVLLPPS